MVKSIITFLSELSGYLKNRERNYSIRLLKDLYEDEQTTSYQILHIESGGDNTVDNAYVVQLYAKLKKTRTLIEILENSEEI